MNKDIAGRMAAPSRRDGWPGMLATAFLALAAAACSTPAPKTRDFDRHRFSQLVQPPGSGGALYFDVTFSPEYPRDDPAADAVRLAWLDGWLKVRRLCPAGREVVNRRPFDFLEDNPARHDERWEIACLPSAVPPG